MLCGISPGFPRLFPARGQVSHVLLTRAPLYSRGCPRFLVRLACVRHAASVDSEPGSNSRLKPDVLPTGRSEDRHPGNTEQARRNPGQPYSVRSLDMTRLLDLTTGTFNLLSKTVAFPPERRVQSNPRTNPRVLETFQTYRELTPPVNAANHFGNLRHRRFRASCGAGAAPAFVVASAARDKPFSRLPTARQERPALLKEPALEVVSTLRRTRLPGKLPSNFPAPWLGGACFVGLFIGWY